MKKVSVFGLLAAIIAVASSFSTEFRRVPTDSWFQLQTPPLVADFSANYNGTYNDVSAYITTKRELSYFTTAICPSGSTKVCAVRIDYEKSAPVDQLNGSASGDFTTAEGTDILGYKYRGN